MPHLMPGLTTEEVRARKAAVAVLPIGSFEQHGPYLPLITDTAIACIIANEIADAYPVQSLPPITISCSHEHKAWPGTVSISSRTLYAIIADVQQSLRQSGISKLILINGHGGNYVLKNIVQEATVDGHRMALFPASADWAQARAAAGMTTNDHEDMHAGELETSILLYGSPRFVRNGYQDGDHTVDERPDLLTVGMEAYTTSGIIGRPSLASASKGKSAVARLVESFTRCLDIITDKRIGAGDGTL